MLAELMREYLSTAEAAASVDYSDIESVRRHNDLADRLRTIVDEVVSLGPRAVQEFATLLEGEPAAAWIAHHLVEKANLDPATLSRCFDRVEQAKAEAEEKGDIASSMGEGMWLREWKARTA